MHRCHPRVRAALVVAALSWAVGVACAHAPEPIVSGDGSDVATGVTTWPGAAWLPLQEPLGGHRMEVVVVVNGAPAVATIDTGATDTSMSSATARRLGLSALVDAATERREFADAHGERAEARRIVVDSLALGSEWLEDVGVWVLPGDGDLFLIGMDQLRRHDILLDVEQGHVGLFPAGTGPRDSDITIPLRAEENALLVDVEAAGRSETARATLIVDTGAESTMFPSAPAVMAGVDADLRFKKTTVGVLSTRQQAGRFRIDHLRVGGVDVGAVAAYEDIANGGQGPGLLGIDALGRFRVVIVTSGPTPALHLWRLPPRAPTRTTGPQGETCSGGCVGVKLEKRTPFYGVPLPQRDYRTVLEDIAADQLRGGDGSTPVDGPRVFVPSTDGRDDGVCLGIEIHRLYAGQRLEFAVTDAAETPGGRLAGHALTFFIDEVPALGYRACLPLPQATAAMGLTLSTPLSLRFVRTNAAVVEHCEGDICLHWTGP
jgi:clan AA aspartic protease (TIGR02281 family)